MKVKKFTGLALFAILLSGLVLAWNITAGDTTKPNEPTANEKAMFKPSQPPAIPIMPPVSTTTREQGEFQLDHFKVYLIEPMPVNALVYLFGQFDENWKMGFVSRYTRFLNPVDKNGESIIDRNHHMNWYDIQFDDVDPQRQVNLFNQFGDQFITIDQPVALLTPCIKVEDGSEPPAVLDHYKVYRVSADVQPVNVPVTLLDQFGFEENIALQPVYFAVPVYKFHDGVFWTLTNANDHIVFYQIKPRPIGQERETIDQFVSPYMITIQSELLGVPSCKLSWSEVH